MHPFVATGVDVVLRAEWTLVEHTLGTLIDDGTFVAGKWQAIFIVLKKILPYLRSDFFKDEAQVRGDRIIAKIACFVCNRSRNPKMVSKQNANRAMR